MIGGSSPALGLIGLLDVFALQSDDAIRQHVVDTAAENFGAEIVGIVCDGAVVKATGIGEGDGLAQLLLDAVEDTTGTMESPLGRLHVGHVPIEGHAVTRFVVLRTSAPFSHEEIRVCRAIVRLMRLAVRTVSAFDEQREITAQLASEASTNKQLNSELHARHTDLMGRMIGIQAQLSSAPGSVLSTIVDHGGALFDGAVLFLHLLRDDGLLELHKLDPEAPEGLAELLRLLDPQTVLLGRALETDQLVATEVNDLVLRTLAAQVSTPIHHQRQAVGVLTVAALDDDRTFTRSDHETLLLLAGYASVAITDSRIIAEREAALDEAEWQATHDSLTGLANRRLIIDTINERLNAGRNVIALYIDVDRFKSVNDLYGHQVGDEFITEVGRRLCDAIRPEDLAGRLAGDEFIVVVDLDETTSEAAYLLAERLRAQLNQPVSLKGRSLTLSVSVGLAVSKGLSEASEVINAADVAMYKAKSGGRNRTGLFDESLQQQIRRRATLAEGVESAVKSGDGFRLVYQPIVDIASRRAKSYETLLRYTDPVLGAVTPDEFIPLAEELGLISEIDDWVLANAMSEAAAVPGKVRLSVNVSPAWLADPSAINRLAELSHKHGMPLRRLGLEITERAALSAAVPATLARLRAIGVRVLLDDFGTGYSSLAYIRTLDIDAIKIDKGFLDGVNDDRHTIAILEAIVTLTDRLGAQAIAEGVETEEQAQLLASLGCRWAQGYHFGRPGPADEVLTSESLKTGV